MHVNQVRPALDAGHNTTAQIAEYLDMNYRHVARELATLTENGDLDRWREGHAYVYGMPGDSDTDDAASMAESMTAPAPAADPAADGGSDPEVDRAYDWDEYVLSDVPEYEPHNGELDRIEAIIESRHDTGERARFLIGGPTGCGKTTLAEHIAAKNGWPIITIQGRYSMYDVDLVGQTKIRGNSTVWVDGPLTKALLASQDGPVVLLVDEANRSRPEAASVLFSALDHRASITLDERGGETIRGDPLNLISFATINEGRGYYVEDIDTAVRRRYGRKFEVDYLGVTHPDREAAMVVDRTPAGAEVADLLVKASNAVRDLAAEGDSIIDTGVPTSTVLSWANTAYAYDTQGIDNPLLEAGIDTVVTPLYDRPDERDEVTSTLTSHLDGAPFDADEMTGWIDGRGGEMHDELICESCGWATMREEPDSQARADAFDTHECPNCGDTMTYGETMTFE